MRGRRRVDQEIVQPKRVRARPILVRDHDLVIVLDEARHREERHVIRRRRGLWGLVGAHNSTVDRVRRPRRPIAIRRPEGAHDRDARTYTCIRSHAISTPFQSDRRTAYHRSRAKPLCPLSPRRGASHQPRPPSAPISSQQHIARQGSCRRLVLSPTYPPYPPAPAPVCRRGANT